MILSEILARDRPYRGRRVVRLRRLHEGRKGSVRQCAGDDRQISRLDEPVVLGLVTGPSPRLASDP